MEQEEQRKVQEEVVDQQQQQEEILGEEEEEEETLRVRLRSSGPHKEHSTTLTTDELDNETHESNGGANGFVRSALVVQQEPKKLGNGIAADEIEEGAKAENGRPLSDTCVYYDKYEGIWKCRICCWTYQSGNICSDHIRNPKDHLHRLMNGKPLNPSGPCFNFETKGPKLMHLFSGSENGRDPEDDKLNLGSRILGVQIITSSALDYQEKQKLNGGGSLSSIKTQHSELLLKEHTASTTVSDIKEIESAEAELVDESDLEATDFDVEKVIQKQNTHDLYCPNCNSCITRRVILRKRKRRIRTPGEDLKRSKQETVGSGLESIPAQANSNQGLSISDDSSLHVTNDRQKEPDIFRCLSCFSFFIPAGNGLFTIFGKKKDESVPNEQTPTVRKNWFSSFFTLDKGNTSVRQEVTVGEGSLAESIDNAARGKISIGAVVPSSSLNDLNGKFSTMPEVLSPAHAFGKIIDSKASKAQEDQDKILSSSEKEPPINGKATINILEADDGLEGNKGITGEVLENLKQYQTVTTPAEKDNGVSAKDLNPLPQQDGLKLLISSQVESPTPEISRPDQQPYQETEKKSIAEGATSSTTTTTTTTISLLKQSDVDSKAIVDTPHEYKHVETSIPTESTTGATGLKVYNTGKDIVITVEAGALGTKASPSAQGGNVLAEAGASSIVTAPIGVVERKGAEAKRVKGIEIIKSIVYGGLVESITSLSVVSSAAGGDAGTLNIIALGLANLIAGLLILFDNLWELKKDHSEQESDQVTERENRYQKLLGQKENFLIHAVFAVLSYIIFGLLPPVIYGFSFRETDDRELKLVAVAAASFVCILVLSTGKAYTQRPPKSYVKTVLYYVTMGIMVSGISYVVGVGIQKLLEQLSLFQQSGSATNLLLPEMTPTNPAWASY